MIKIKLHATTLQNYVFQVNKIGKPENYYSEINEMTESVMN